MPRPYRVPFGIAGVVAISIPPVALGLLSMALANDATRYVSLASIAAGPLVYRWQSKPVAAEVETASTP